MNPIKLIAPALLTVLAACAAPPGNTYTLYVDPNFDTEAQHEIEEAAQDWKTAVGPELKITTVVAPCPGGPMLWKPGMVCVHSSPTATVPCMGAVDPLILGCTLPEGDDAATVTIATNLAKTLERPQIIRHELGHAMGLSHDHEGTLMYHNVSGGHYVPTCEDIRQWHGVRGETFSCES
jgi:hypothetical protein